MVMYTSLYTITDPGGAGTLKVPIITLPDEAILEIFKFYVIKAYGVERWITLAHVCRRWRYIVFASPRRLDLRFLLKGKAPVREMLDIWRALPIMIWPRNSKTEREEVADNIIAALEYRDRVWDISLTNFAFPNSRLQRLVAAMQHPFPVLTQLELRFWLDDGMTVVLPDSFLGRSAPRLQTLLLRDAVFPALQNLLLSADNLVKLSLLRIPNAGYISPDAMVTSLSSLTRLQSFDLGFETPRSRPSRSSRRLLPIIPTVLPVLTRFSYTGVSEYLEDIVAQIDTPLLDTVHITFFNQLIFDISQFPHFTNFINRIEKLEQLDQANVTFWNESAEVALSLKTETVRHISLVLEISCTQADWQLSSIAQLCGMSFPPISTLEHLRIDDPLPSGQDDMEHGQWLEILYPFNSVKNLYLNEGVGLRIATALKGLTGASVIEMLPALQGLYIKGLQPSGPTWEAVESFVTARQSFGHLTAVERWK